MKPRFAVALAFSSSLAFAGAARASDAEVDPSHGRIEGDVAAVGAAGLTFGPTAPRLAGDVRFRYLSTAGLFATYEDGPAIGSASDPRRVLAVGIELRPLFLARWFQGRETGNAYFDLTLDSFALELGAVFLQPAGGDFASKPGLQAGLGLELPIFPNATGPLVGVHGGCRWSNDALGGGPIQGPVDRALYLMLVVGWQQVFGGHLVDFDDRAPR
ncbi:hypothetical protein AKJ09_06437 [Labilithrix luteola]|uniref:Outer membrane protein beta-barrel domain-containing protein n=1 Tax=Labilithrix luteola TaxID=1391654 RepID=A0A0K1Q1W7_9BACT|nr:hypothetical protein [Labilithrix luteola]AKU99773.1 hypothetical protein AKJ09_06437 [Labilithrix luteola]